MPRKHFVIPDTQCRTGIPLNHLTAAGNYIVEKKPEVIIHLGDHWDMHSLSQYDKGTAKGENADYQKDVDVGIKGMELLLKPLQDYNRFKVNKYKPRLVFLLGNHEQRIERYANSNPALRNKTTYKDLHLKDFGWEVHDFLKPVDIDGITYSHYFYNPNTGKPFCGKASTMLNNIGFSFTMGHQQGKDLAEKHLSNGRTIRGLVVGSFYQHQEEYKGPQGNHHWRGCIMKHEVEKGNYSLMEVSLSYFLKKYQ